MPSSILEAIKLGMWDFEPTQEPRATNEFSPTDALPGSEDKLQVLAERVRLGLPLWHERDRLYYGRTSED